MRLFDTGRIVSKYVCAVVVIFSYIPKTAGNIAIHSCACSGSIAGNYGFLSGCNSVVYKETGLAACSGGRRDIVIAGRGRSVRRNYSFT